MKTRGGPERASTAAPVDRAAVRDRLKAGMKTSGGPQKASGSSSPAARAQTRQQTSASAKAPVDRAAVKQRLKAGMETTGGPQRAAAKPMSKSITSPIARPTKTVNRTSSAGTKPTAKRSAVQPGGRAKPKTFAKGGKVRGAGCATKGTKFSGTY